jgi:hypothetical protein
MESLRMLSTAFKGNVREMVVNEMASFGPLQENAAERILLTFARLEWLEQTGEADRDDIRAVLRRSRTARCLICIGSITRHKFALQTAANWTNTRIWLQAVSAILTRLCFRHLRLRHFDRTRCRTGPALWHGLQLINVLRDAGTDLRGVDVIFG